MQFWDGQSENRWHSECGDRRRSDQNGVAPVATEVLSVAGTGKTPASGVVAVNRMIDVPLVVPRCGHMHPLLAVESIANQRCGVDIGARQSAVAVLRYRFCRPDAHSRVIESWLGNGRHPVCATSCGAATNQKHRRTLTPTLCP